jgi:4-amino-4-deoxy-L-arabinose transferase-like glycosyltransferase
MSGTLGVLRTVLLVAFAAIALLAPAVGRRVIATSDEARFPLLARDLMHRGTWYEAYVREKQYRNKPPLFPWAILALSRLQGGITDGTAQAPVAVAAVGAAVFASLMGRAMFGARAGLWAGLMLLTSAGFYAHALLVLPDMLVACFATAAGWAFWRSVTEDRPGVARAWLAGFWTAVALAVFSKGPLGLLPVLVVSLWLLLDRGPAGLARLWSPWALALFVGVTALWVLPFVMLGGRSFGSTVLWSNWLHWFLGAPRPLEIANFLLDALKGFLPWSLLLPLVWGPARRAWRLPAVRLALLWGVLPLALMALSANPMERYALAGWPGLALVTAWWADRHAATAGRAGRVLGGAVAALAAVMAVTFVVAGPALSALQPEAAVPTRPLALPLALAVAAVGAAFLAGLRAGRPDVLVVGSAAAMAVGLAYFTWVTTGAFNRVNDFPGVAAMLERHARGEETRVLGGRYFQVELYLGRSMPRIWTVEDFNQFVLSPERHVALVDERGWRTIHDRVPPEVRVLDRLHVRGRDMLVVGHR